MSKVKKIIDLPKSSIPTIKKLAAREGRTVKNYIEFLILNKIENEKQLRNETAAG